MRKVALEGPSETLRYSRMGKIGSLNHPDMDKYLSEPQFPHWYNEVIVKFLLNRIIVKMR